MSGDSAAVRRDDGVRDRKPQTCSGLGDAALGREKRLKNMLKHFRRHSAAVVADGQFDRAVSPGNVNRYAAALWLNGREGIEREIQDDLLHFTFAGNHAEIIAIGRRERQLSLLRF